MPIAVIWLAALWVVSGGVAALERSHQQQPTFRAAADIIVIDTHVVARDGSPIEGLKPDQFQVLIDGRRRPVVSADLVRVGAAPGRGDAASAPSVENAGATGRTIVLAIDEASFPVTAQQAAREAATRVLDRVAAEDAVGIVTFPGQVAIAPSRDHRAVREAVSRVTGARIDLSPSSRFNLATSEAVQLRSRAPVASKEIVDRECGREWPPNPSCSQELMEHAASIAVGLEQQGMLTIAGLHGAIDAMASLPGRKTLIVISAGLPMSTQRGARPDFTAETARIASRAAAANINLYVFYMNVHFLRFFSPAYGKRNYAIYDDITMFGYGLEQFADAAGGAFFQIEVDSDPFVNRALRETSAAYLLAVRAEPRDRDGKEHFIRVSVRNAGGATVRYRKVFTIPSGGFSFPQKIGSGWRKAKEDD